MQLDCAHHAEAQDAAELDECEGGELTDTTRGLKLSRVPWFAAWLRGEEAETELRVSNISNRTTGKCE